MSEDDRLRRLSALAGIESHYWDIAGARHETPPDTARRLLSALGFPASNEAELTASLATIEEREWRRLLPPVMVVRLHHIATVPLNLPADEPRDAVEWRVVLEDGEIRRGTHAHHTLKRDARRFVDGRDIDRLLLPLPALPLGYHEFLLDGFPSAPRMSLVVAPVQCYLPPQLTSGRRLWGLAAQLYSITSERDRGIGDFTDLGTLAQWAAELGADAIGLNPLHALFPSLPENASPYSPNSRLFRNSLYLDVTAIDEYRHSAAVQGPTTKPAFSDFPSTAHSVEFVDYTTVTHHKSGELERLHSEFRRACRVGSDDGRADAFQNFRNRRSEALHHFALFQVMTEVFGTNDWTQWPLPYRDPSANSVSAFTQDHAERVSFFEYVQWQCDLQIGGASQRARDAGMAIGLYGDVAVSVDPAGADHWSRQTLFAGEARLGAPPDPFNALGQEWGVVPMNPWVMRDTAYADFIALLRANMCHAGALRIDHVMGLQHSFWVPRGSPPSAGAYVSYPFDDLLGILALESHRNECLIVGEALGTVPEGFRPRMAEANVLSYRVLYFETEQDRQRRPVEYPYLAATCVSTHDLATLKGFWNATDLDARRRLGLYPTPEHGERARHEREHDKWLLLRALADENLLPSGLDTDRLGDIEMTPALASAVHAYLARSSACLFMVQIDDLIGEDQQVNLPGTSSEYPNWRRRLSRSLNEIFSDPGIVEMARRISREREQTSGA
ncbi:MAG: 4-alpha-glucanotransferase [Parvibaculum sedimenti]|uniref:4-alpha-glucanotransferase n=1 Tax=Parvibaculum sedimenti TaxID=2608632 RepID=UPI003BB7A5FD